MRFTVFLALTVFASRTVLAQLVAEEVTRFALDGVDSLGLSMSVHSETVLLGAVGPGAYLFQFDGANWWMESLTVNGDPWDVTHVSVHGDLALIGVPPSAFLFRYDGGRWVQEAVFQDDEADLLQDFGESVAVGDDVALVAAPSHSVHVFRFDGRGWTREAKLAPERAEGEGPPYGFAREVAVDGDRALVLKDSTMGDNFEGSYVFAFDGAAWRQEAVLVLEDSESPFQGAIALDSDTALISADYDDEVHVFRREGSSWRREGVLVPPDLGEACLCLSSSPGGRGVCSTENGKYREFGVSMALDSGLAPVGALKGDGGSNEGAVYVFRSDGDCWTHSFTIRDESTVGFGRTVALHEGSALIRTNSPNHGVHLFRIRESVN